MFLRQLLNDETACASYLFGCNTAGELAVVDAHADLVDDYVAAAEAQGSRIAAVLETHIQADRRGTSPGSTGSI
jgi:glyoxylase-like metal-dependent hydrolase (beta-lactamase superfamily II)